MTTSNIAAEQIEEEENKKFRTLFPDSEENYNKCLKLRNLDMFKDFLENEKSINGNKIIFLCQNLSDSDISFLKTLTTSDNIDKVNALLEALSSDSAREACIKKITTFVELKAIGDADKINILTSKKIQLACEDGDIKFSELKKFNLNDLNKLKLLADSKKIWSDIKNMMENRYFTISELIECDDAKIDVLTTLEAWKAYLFDDVKFSELKKFTVNEIKMILELPYDKDKKNHMTALLLAQGWMHNGQKIKTIDKKANLNQTVCKGNKEDEENDKDKTTDACDLLNKYEL